VAEGALDRGRASIARLRGLVHHQRSTVTALVRIEPIALGTIASELDAIERELVRDHPRALDPFLARAEAAPNGSQELRKVLIGEHGRFPESIDQLRWFYGVVLHDDHGGHRQALGQYWAILLESVARHLEDEAAYLGPHAASERSA
jgi:hypothetical protein